MRIVQTLLIYLLLLPWGKINHGKNHVRDKVFYAPKFKVMKKSLRNVLKDRFIYISSLGL